MIYDNLSLLTRKALGKEKSDLVLKNGRVINVFTEEILECDVAIDSGVIVGVGTYSGKEEVDLGGKFVVPGFIDSHLHLESTLVTPKELIQNALACGTTTFIIDPHEAANVAGPAGIDYILEQTKACEANVYVMMPSCVPSSKEEDNGCILNCEKMKDYIDHPRVLGLGEVMDYSAVTGADPEMRDKLKLFADKIKDGHAPFLEEKQLTAYALAGIKTDHECTEFDYAMKERRNGMQILIREGSGARNLESIINGIVKYSVDTTGFSFCTDDKHIDDIKREGHINYNIRKSVSLGIPAVKAIKMATLNAAVCYQLKHLGAVAPGYQADIVVLDDLEEALIHSVYHKGTKVDLNKKAVIKRGSKELYNSVHIKKLIPEMLEYPTDGKEEPVIEMISGQILTKALSEVLPNENGLFVPSRIYNKAIVVERHRASGKVGVAAVKGFGIFGGAAATSVSHDSHNIISIGDNDRDILLAVEELERIQGGHVIIKDGRVLESLPLPIMGLMSDAGFEEVEEKLGRMIGYTRRMGISADMDPFITLSFIALNVIPEIRVTTRGIYNVTKECFYRK